MAVPVVKISTTERQTFKRCRLQWHFSSYGRLNLEPILPDTRLWFGTGVHAALEAYYGERVDPVEYWLAWTEEEFQRLDALGFIRSGEEWENLYAHRELGRGMLLNYVAFATENDDFQVVATEQQFEVPIRRPGSSQHVGFLVGRFDGICQTADGRFWLLEHKTAAQAWSPYMFVDDDQTLGYLWAAQQLFPKPLAGVYFNILRKKLPKPPRVLQNGKLSVAKDQDTTYEVYAATIQEQGLDPAEYTSILDHLREKGNSFFQRERVLRSPREIEVFGAQLYDEYIDMASDPRIYPNLTWDCAWGCDYRSLCQAWRNGEDWEMIARAQFRTRDLSGTTYEPFPTDEEESV